jgi:nucleotide-binding universal stress UspA family protein
MTRILIAFDGSELDQTLASTAHRLFGDDADYWAVNVQNEAGVVGAGAASVPMPLGFGGAYPYAMPGLYTMRERDAAEQSMMDSAEQRSRRTIDQSGLDDAKVVSEIGPPDEAIIRAAELHQVDLIIAGTHDRGWWSKLLQPSVSEGLLADSTVPVLLVKASGST